jgi:uncharacterized protein (UPF0332 family)
MISLINKNECFEKGMLKKEAPNLDLAKKSLKQAEFFLKETADLIELAKKQIAVISLYNAFFHISRALLYKEGVKERSHYCIAKYIEEDYVNKNRLNVKFLNTFETIMSMRHNIQYSTETTDIDIDLNEFYNICEEYLAEVDKIL